MAKTSGSNNRTGGHTTTDANYKGEIKNVKSLVTIKHPDVYKEVKSAISRFHAVMGVRQREVKLATLSGAVGVHVTGMDGKSQGIYLNSKIFNGTKASIIAQKKSGYASGFLTRTNKPIQHTVTHELAHATWNNRLSSPNAKAAGKEVGALYNKWLRDTKKKGYGSYAKSNVNEFFAETTTKAIHGNSDKYTKKVKGIIRKYKL